MLVAHSEDSMIQRERVSISIPPALYEALERARVAEGGSRSRVVCAMLIEGLTVRGLWPPRHTPEPAIDGRRIIE